MTAQPRPDLHLVAVRYGQRGPAPATTKRCTKCGETKPLDEFRRHSGNHGTKDEKLSWCRACERNARNKRREGAGRHREGDRRLVAYERLLATLEPRFPCQSEEWKLQAACRGVGPSMFFLPRGANKDVAAAKELCASCPVSGECADYAVRNHEPDGGIWAGTTPRKLRKLRRLRAAS